MYVHKLAELVGTSKANLQRWNRQNAKLDLNALAYKPGVVRAVCRHYEQHGRAATQEAFPDVKVRSIVERFRIFKPRQVRWTSEQIADAAKMAGLVSLKAQAKYFNRPFANEGSVKSLWAKRLGSKAASVNGMAQWQARFLVTERAPYLQARARALRVCLWVDMEKHLRVDVPEFIASAIKTMADFQRWLWQSQNPRPLILRMIREREIA